MKLKDLKIVLYWKKANMSNIFKNLNKVCFYKYVNFQKEHDSGIRRLNQEWDKKFTELEDAYFATEGLRKDLENENSGLKAEI